MNYHRQAEICVFVRLPWWCRLLAYIFIRGKQICLNIFIIITVDGVAVAVAATADTTLLLWLIGLLTLLSLLNFALVCIFREGDWMFHPFTPNFRNITEPMIHSVSISRIIFWTLIPKRLITFHPGAMKTTTTHIGFSNQTQTMENNWKNLVSLCHRWKINLYPNICFLNLINFCAQNVRRKNWVFFGTKYRKSYKFHFNFYFIEFNYQHQREKRNLYTELHFTTSGNYGVQIIALLHWIVCATWFMQNYTICHFNSTQFNTTNHTHTEYIYSKCTKISICSLHSIEIPIDFHIFYIRISVGIWFFFLSPTLSFNKQILK